ncbi:MarR family transcriptional regulator [Desulfitobacterium hafniense]|uniref:MarR family transcriptional regulator n=1 Tax=Desulfitobacterium hafniense TaxID=49338 RepID=UPI001FA6CC23|nr:MarR family transcriptional regulator [Desulfitobacterium hafniense]
MEVIRSKEYKMKIAKDIMDTLLSIQQDMDSMTHKFDDLNFSQVHCLHWIGTMENPNVTKIAAELRMTTGAVTKICKKLSDRNYIVKYQNPENNKEVYYRLTEKGQAIYEAHEVVHDSAHHCQTDVIDRYSIDEQRVILKFLQDIYALMNNEAEQVTEMVENKEKPDV